MLACWGQGGYIFCCCKVIHQKKETCRTLHALVCHGPYPPWHQTSQYNTRLWRTDIMCWVTRTFWTQNADIIEYCRHVANMSATLSAKALPYLHQGLDLHGRGKIMYCVLYLHIHTVIEGGTVVMMHFLRWALWTTCPMLVAFPLESAFLLLFWQPECLHSLWSMGPF